MDGVVVVVFLSPPLARRPLFRKRDALPSFLAATLLGRRRDRWPWEKRRPQQKEADDAGPSMRIRASVLVNAESAVQ
jgi:hypothetical protein